MLTTTIQYYQQDNASLHVYIAILVALICSVSFYVLLKWRIRRIIKSSPFMGTNYVAKKANPNIYSPLPIAIMQTRNPRPGCRLGRSPTHGPSDIMFQSLIRQQCPPSGPVDLMSPVSTVQTYADLPSSKKRKFESSLCRPHADGKDWKVLATHLGFSDADVLRFGNKCDHKFGSAHHLLQAWMQREGCGAHLNVLVTALTIIGRSDLTPLLQSSAIHPSDSFHHTEQV